MPHHIFNLLKCVSIIFIGDPINQGYTCLSRSYKHMPIYIQSIFFYNSKVNTFFFLSLWLNPHRSCCFLLSRNVKRNFIYQTQTNGTGVLASISSCHTYRFLRFSHQHLLQSFCMGTYHILSFYNSKLFLPLSTSNFELSTITINTNCAKSHSL